MKRNDRAREREKRRKKRRNFERKRKSKTDQKKIARKSNREHVLRHFLFLSNTHTYIIQLFFSEFRRKERSTLGSLLEHVNTHKYTRAFAHHFTSPKHSRRTGGDQKREILKN